MARGLPWQFCVTVAMLAIACTGAPGAIGSSDTAPIDSVVDGWPIGGVSDCLAVPCHEMARAATEALGRRDPGHAEIASVTIHNRRQEIPIRSTAPKIAVFHLADGSTRAIGVYETFTGPMQTIDFGP